MNNVLFSGIVVVMVWFLLRDTEAPTLLHATAIHLLELVGLVRLRVWVFEQAGEREEWVVAASAWDASRVYQRAMGQSAEPLPNADEVGYWRALPDDEALRLSDDCAPSAAERKTCGEWASGGRRYLGSANW